MDFKVITNQKLIEEFEKAINNGREFFAYLDLSDRISKSTVSVIPTKGQPLGIFTITQKIEPETNAKYYGWILDMTEGLGEDGTRKHATNLHRIFRQLAINLIEYGYHC